MKPKLLRAFRRGLLKVAQTTGIEELSSDLIKKSLIILYLKVLGL